VKAEFLVFNDSRLASLANLPYMTCIMKVEMCYNKIKIGLEAFAIFPNLRFLKLRGNRISSFDEVHKLSCVKLLQSLDLQQNPVALDQDYRSNVFNELE
jgi:hypothetical protein